MESITLKTFLDSRAQLGPDTFFNRVRPKAHFYSNVLTANMDSRTGLLALLTSRLIPWEAYRRVDIARYEPLARGRSIVDLMKDNGYYSVIATSQVVSEGTVRDFRWDENLVLTDGDKK